MDDDANGKLELDEETLKQIEEKMKMFKENDAKLNPDQQ